jgi:hypothetical protein
MIPGARVLSARLATCSSCGVLHVKEDDGREIYVRRAREGERVTLEAPPCLAPPRFAIPW